MSLLLSLLLIVSGQLTLASWPWSNSFYCWFWQSAIVVDDWLYIDGGEWYDAQFNVNYLTGPLAIGLAQSWTISTIEGQSVNNTKAPIIAQSTARRPAVWYDAASGRIMEQGGWSYGSTSNDAVSFSPDGNGGGSWSVDAAVQPASSYVATFGAAFAASPDTAYMLGGVNAATYPSFQAVSGLTTFSVGNNAWNNISASAASSSSYSVLAQASYIPNFGQGGVLAILGGDEPPNVDYQYEVGTALVQMSNITLYDIHSNTWYSQSTSGSAPPPRSEFCAVGVASQDNATYEIFVFGGSTNSHSDVAHPTDTGYLDVYVLSIPSFHWFKAGAPTDNRRANHFCQHLGGGQMLVIGGRNPSYNSSGDSNYNGGNFWPNSGGDPWTKGLNIFDMTALNWTQSYDSTRTAYTSPAAVQQYAAQSSGIMWDNPALATIFATQPTKQPSPNPNPSSTTHTGAIAGGVAGGIALLGLLTFLTFYLLRRNRRQTAPTPHESTHELPYELAPDAAKYELQSPPTEMPDHSRPPKRPPRRTSYVYVELPTERESG